MNAITYWLTKFTWALACAIIAGQKPHHSPPRAAAGRLAPHLRSNQYQAAAVPAKPTVSSTTTDSPGPKKWVTGANGRLSASTDVLAIMLMPSGTLSRSVKKGL